MCTVMASAWLSEASYGAMLGLVAALGLAAAVCGTLMLYLCLWLTTERRPRLQRAASEKVFSDPSSGSSHPFPSLSDPPSLYLSLVVPAYKEQERLPKMMSATMEYLEKRKSKDESFTYEVIIVNDGSSDGTSEEALKLVSQYGTATVRLLELEKNRGKGGAVRLGCLSARGERLLFADADGATSISDLGRLEERLDVLTTDYRVPALAIGSRAHLQDEAVAKRSFFRNILMYGFHFLVHLTCVQGIRDTQCGFKLLTRAASSRLFTLMHIDRWAFDVELLYIAQRLGMPIAEVPVNWQEIEGSKLVPVLSWLQMGRDLVFIRLRYLFGLWTLPAPAPRPKAD